MTSNIENNWQNKLYTGDNLYILNGMNSESVDLIYLDPPFNSKRLYSAPVGSKAAGSSFKDMWTWEDVDESYLEKLSETHPYLVRYIQSIKGSQGKAMMSYITYMAERIIEMHRVLKETGSFYLHCDPTASHYLKNVLDFIFGKENFLNEIVWSYSTGGISKKHYARKHDIILFYSKNKDLAFFHLPRVESRDPNRFNLEDEDGRMYYEKAGNRYYLDDGVAVRDVWDIHPVRNTSVERTGYPTQKPLALIERIIKASSKEGDVVLDPFCGCATTCVAADKLKRKWIGIDIEKKAVELLIERLEKEGEYDGKGTTMSFKKKDLDFIHLTKPPVRTDVQIIEITPETKTEIRKTLFEQQKGCCNGCMVQMRIFDFEIDHVIPKAKGGGDYYENYQLLCGNCNKTKGDRPMEYLRNKIRAREELMKDKFTFGE
ncbi:MAG: hypothetical protein RL208_231 [Pseudomonadota bacterium]|jgi:site-specific DNA-methyltransferase (adenine-specific)